MRVILGFKKTVESGAKWYWFHIAKGINWWTKSNYFHVEMCFEGKWVGAHTARGVEVFECSEEHHNIHRVNGKIYGSPDYDYYELTVDDLTDLQKKNYGNG